MVGYNAYKMTFAFFLLISNKIMVKKELKTAGYNFEECYEKKYGCLYLLPDKKVLICELTSPYVPIEKFQKIFKKAGELIQTHALEKFVFDKRNLRAFHQPSMEWYFLVWKEEMYRSGLRVHRKLLPDEAWFEQAVAAGRAKIREQNPQSIVDLLDIQYKYSLTEAVES
jgi:hypothetical protein